MQKLLLIIFLLLPMSIHAEEKSSFWSKTDEFLLKGTEWISKKDKITGMRSLNTSSDKKEKKRGIQALYNHYASTSTARVFKKVDAASRTSTTKVGQSGKRSRDFQGQSSNPIFTVLIPLIF